MEILLEVRDLFHTFGVPPEHRTVLDGVSTRFHAGEILILRGPSGAGKTTLLTLAAGLRSIQQGSVQVLGQELFQARQRILLQTRRNIGFIFQNHNLIQAMTVLQNVQIALASDPGETTATSIRKAMRSLEDVGMADYAGKDVATLSGGQKQRVAIARGLVRNPSIIIADEPTASLDRANGNALIALLQERARRYGCCVIIVTHDDRILDAADRLLHLEDGRLTEQTSRS